MKKYFMLLGLVLSLSCFALPLSQNTPLVKPQPTITTLHTQNLEKAALLAQIDQLKTEQRTLKKNQETLQDEITHQQRVIHTLKTKLLSQHYLPPLSSRGFPSTFLTLHQWAYYAFLKVKGASYNTAFLLPSLKPITTFCQAHRAYCSIIGALFCFGVLLIVLSIKFISTRRTRRTQHTIAQTQKVPEFTRDHEVATQLDLARAYIDMREYAQARHILKHALAATKPDHRAEARKLLKEISK